MEFLGFKGTADRSKFRSILRVILFISILEFVEAPGFGASTMDDKFDTHWK